MEATARVMTVRDGRARLACESRAPCGACGRGCALRWLGGSGSRSLDVPDRADDRQLLRPGQFVTIAVRDGDVLRAASQVYLPPVTGLLAGALLGRWLMGGGDAGTLLVGLSGAIAGWWIARAWSKSSPPRISIRHVAGAAGVD